MFKSKRSITKDNFIYELEHKNEHAMEFVIKNYGKLYKSIIYKYIKDETYIEECLNDVFLSIWKNIDQFEERKNTFVNWSCAVTRYKCIDMLRKNKSAFMNLDNTIDITNLNTSTDDKYMFDEELDLRVINTLNMLSEEDKNLLLDAYVNEKDGEVLASERNIQLSNVYNKLSRARKKFKVIYGGKNEKCL